MSNFIDILSTQESQLSQRGRAMLRVIEQFAKSFKIICHSRWHHWNGMCTSLSGTVL